MLKPQNGICPMFEIYTFLYFIAAACSKVVQINVMCVLLLRILEAHRGYHTLKKWYLPSIME
jgi:hypothetical protein